MATPTSLDSAFAGALTRRKTQKFSFSTPFKASLALSFTPLNPRPLLPPNSGASTAPENCPPLPILEKDAPTDPQKIECELEFLFINHYLASDAKNLNDFLCRLFRDPRTEELGYECYQKAKGRPEFRPWKSTLKHLIRHLVRTEKWDLIESAIEDFKSYHVSLDNYTCSRLIGRCINARKFKISASILNAFGSDGEEAAVSAFYSAMRGYNKLHMYTSTIDVHKRMESLGIDIDSVCLYRIIEAYSRVGDHEKVIKLSKDFEAKTVLDSATPCSAQICRFLFESLGKLGRASEAYKFFRERELQPDSLIYSALISSLASIREVELAEELLTEAMSNKKLRNLAVFQKIISMYLDEGLVEKTLELVRAMKSAEIRVSDNIFCAIINGYSKRRGYSAAAKVYEELTSQASCEPGQVTYTLMINVYCRLGLYPRAEAVFRELEKKGFESVVAYSSMILIYGKTGRLSDAMRLVAQMKRRGCPPNVWVYNTLLEMHGKAKNLRQVEKLWREMKRRKVEADRVSYTTMICAYSKADELETCTRLYEEYIENGGEIDQAMAGIMVGVFSRTDRVDELLKLLQDMKCAGTSLDGRLYWSAFCALRDAGMPLQAKWLQENFGTAAQAMELRGRGRPKEESGKQNNPIVK